MQFDKKQSVAVLPVAAHEKAFRIIRVLIIMGVSLFVRDIFAFSHDCRYPDCTHTHEPGCNVIAAVNNKKISPTRYESYLSILDESEEKYR